MVRHSYLFVLAMYCTCGSLARCQEQQPQTPKLESEAAKFQIKDADGLVSSLDKALLDVSDSLLIADNGLGIDLAPPDAALRAQLGLEENAGLVVTAAPAESLGAKAGLKVHDVLVQAGDEKVGTVERLKEWLGAADGKSVKLRLLRAGKPVEVQVTPKSPDSGKVRLRWAAKDLLLADAERYRIGVTLSETDDTLRAQLRLAAREGLVVTEVVEGSAATAAGIQVNDVLTVLDGKRLTTVEAINAQIQEIKDRSVELRLLRGGKEMALQVAPRKTHEAAFVDRPLRYWDMKTCTRCHADPYGGDTAHLLLAEKLGAAHSAWTDGHLLHYYARLREAKAKPGSAVAPQKQIEALKGQLAEMQKTLAALEASLAKPKEEKEDEKK